MENRRTKLTKRLLKEALIELLLEKDLSHITIKDLSDRADINRSTFYSHYVDIYELLDEITNDYMKTIPFDDGDTPLTIDQIIESIEFVEKHSDVFLVLLKNGLYYNYIINKSKSIFKNGTLNQGKMKNVNQDLYFSMIAFSASGTEKFLLSCLENDLDLTTRQKASIIYNLNIAVREQVKKNS